MVMVKERILWIAKDISMKRREVDVGERGGREARNLTPHIESVD